MYSSIIFNVILLVALAIVSVSAQDEGPGFITKCAKPGFVALTFDDGPSPFTPKLLGYLKKSSIRATFFVLAKHINEKNGKEILKDTYEAGHQIALHSDTHPDMNTISPQEIRKQYETNLKAVFDTIGVHPIMAR
jgi:peptidoglycan/xylan/chitin deacetylase (PgdA/CDA1 family)